MNSWNVRGGCSATWVGGSARFEGSKLHLNAYQQRCEAAQCGTCVYDFHFEVRDAPDGDMTVSLDYTDEHEKQCGDSGSVVIASLPTSRERSGALCSPLGQVGFVTPHCSRNAPCGDMVMGDLGQPASCPTCEGGDLCAPLGAGLGNACLKACAIDADCDNPAMGCRDGGCAIVAPLRSP